MSPQQPYQHDSRKRVLSSSHSQCSASSAKSLICRNLQKSVEICTPCRNLLTIVQTCGEIERNLYKYVRKPRESVEVCRILQKYVEIWEAGRPNAVFFANVTRKVERLGGREANRRCYKDCTVWVIFLRHCGDLWIFMEICFGGFVETCIDLWIFVEIRRDTTNSVDGV